MSSESPFRHLTNLIITFEIFFLAFAPVFGGWLLAAILPLPFFPLLIVYYVWVWYDLDTPNRGGRPLTWMRTAPMWYHLRDYFDAELVKTADLPSDKNYIFGSHPHGLMCFGAQININSDVTGFSQKFPDIMPQLVTLPMQFMFPVRRELLMAQGCITSNASSIYYVLNQKSKGHAVILIPGGAEESLDSHKDNYDLTLKSRKGFVKLAIKTGAHLVPIYSFGETATYHQLPNARGTFVRKLQSAVKHYITMPPAVISGIGMFKRQFLPMPSKIVTVVGPPIDPGHDLNPSQEMIDAAHEKYVNTLVNLFEEHKQKYGIPAEKHLNII